MRQDCRYLLIIVWTLDKVPAEPDRFDSRCWALGNDTTVPQVGEETSDVDPSLMACGLREPPPFLCPLPFFEGERPDLLYVFDSVRCRPGSQHGSHRPVLRIDSSALTHAALQPEVGSLFHTHELKCVLLCCRTRSRNFGIHTSEAISADPLGLGPARCIQAASLPLAVLPHIKPL